jgi:hypothetical protein
MNLDDEFNLEHLLFKQRKCRTCGITKDLLIDYYLIRKDRGKYPSSYSYECKQCTKKRVSDARKKVVDKMVTNIFGRWEYPDW